MAERTLDTANLIFGTWWLRLGGTNLGAFRGAGLTFNQETLEHEVGVPLTVDKEVALRERATFTATIEELSVENFEFATGAAASAVESGAHIDVGGWQVKPELPLELVMRRDDGTITVLFFKTVVSEGFDWAFADDNFQGLPCTWKVLADPDHDNALFQIQVITNG